MSMLWLSLTWHATLHTHVDGVQGVLTTVQSQYSLDATHGGMLGSAYMAGYVCAVSYGLLLSVNW